MALDSPSLESSAQLFASGQVLNLSEHQFSHLQNGADSFCGLQGICALKVKGDKVDWRSFGNFGNWVSNALQTTYEELGRGESSQGGIEVSGDSS